MTKHGADRAREALSAAIRRCAEGDHAALEQVYQATAAKLFGICLRICRDRREAEDALQETFVAVWNRADRFDPARASPISWLAVLARNAAVDRLRAGGKVRQGAVGVEAAAQVPATGPAPDESLAASQQRARIEMCLGELEAKQGNAIRRAFFDGATYAQLAEGEGVPQGTMKSWIRRGLKRLRDCLGEQ